MGEGALRTGLLCLALASTAHVHGDQWRFPAESDVTGSWQEYGVPYRVTGDFDGDGVNDEVSIVFSTTEDRWYLIALLKDREIELVLFTSASENPQDYGVDVASPGSHRTACGKGYWECAAGEPGLLEIENPAVRFFLFESASRLFYWDPVRNAFAQVWESD